MRASHYSPLFWRVLALNAGVLVAACAMTLLIVSPRDLSSIAAEEGLVLVGALALLAGVNLVLLRGALRPLERVTRFAQELDPNRPGQRVPWEADTSEAGQLAGAINEMLGRLETERRLGVHRALQAQERERLRVAQELHDQVGQALTGVLLQLSRVVKHSPPAQRAEAIEAQEAVRACLDDVRKIAIELRPEALDELGLWSALAALAERLSESGGVRIERRVDTALPDLSEEVELVIYRVAQEALTNVMRHAEVKEAELDPRASRRSPRPARRRLWSGAAVGRRRGGGAARHARASGDGRRGPDGCEPRQGRGRGRARGPACRGGMVIPLKTRILLADDHAVVRRGLHLLLDAEPDMEVVAEAGDGAEALERALAEDVHLAILDVTMPRMTGLQAIGELLRRKPELKVLILTMHESEQYLYEALKAGASGYVLKSAADLDLVRACRGAMRGEPFLYPAAITALIRDYLERGADDDADAADPLTARETEVVKLVAESHTSKEIAELLVISEKTVERHRANILEKLGMRDRVALTRYAIRRGLIEP